MLSDPLNTPGIPCHDIFNCLVRSHGVAPEFCDGIILAVDRSTDFFDIFSANSDNLPSLILAALLMDLSARPSLFRARFCAIPRDS